MMKRWTWAGAKAVGGSHVDAGTPCEDAVVCDVLRRAGRPDVLIAGVADGAGSAEHARIGAVLAASLFVETVRSSLDEDPDRTVTEDLVRHGIKTARQSVLLFAARHGRRPRSYASTLVGCVMHESGGVIAQVGDGAAVIALAASPNEWRVPIWPDHGEYINTTSFLTDDDGEEKVRFASLAEPAAHVSLFTDGLERLVLDFTRRAPHGPFFRAVFQELNAIPWGQGESHWASAELRRLLESERVAKRTDDDRTLLIASLREVGDGRR